ncbi:hypothetical protein CPB86DRAFT_821128 [Serendipita vermifera]|nr:hypothetical protein CPB86DRAFT_821128 [Serendipita vermifera]
MPVVFTAPHSRHTLSYWNEYPNKHYTKNKLPYQPDIKPSQRERRILLSAAGNVEREINVLKENERRSEQEKDVMNDTMERLKSELEAAYQSQKAQKLSYYHFIAA